MNTSIYLIFIIYICIIEHVTSKIVGLTSYLSIRGGLVPQDVGDGVEYYEKFRLDYGNDDKIRSAGSLRGFIKTGNVASVPETDPFCKWINEHLENGPEDVTGRLKPFYAADFGSRSDLKKGENPKLVIVQRKLDCDESGALLPGSSDIDVEVREVWQPWLKVKCDFVVRYVIPNRANIIKIMEKKKRFFSELEVKSDETNKRQSAYAKFTFRPSLIQRLLGKQDTVMRRPLSNSVLDDSRVSKSQRRTSSLSSSSSSKKS